MNYKAKFIWLFLGNLLFASFNGGLLWGIYGFFLVGMLGVAIVCGCAAVGIRLQEGEAR